MIRAMTGCLAAVLMVSGAAHGQDAQAIAPGDLVYVDVMRLPEFSTTGPVDAQGFITMPYIGPVAIGGLTESEAAARLRDALQRMVRNPRVSVSRSGPAFFGGARTTQMKTELVPLQNAQAASLSVQLAGMASDGGAISYDTNTNTLILTDTPDVLRNMISIVNRLDQMQTQLTQVRIEAKIAEVQIGALKELGVRWFVQDDKFGGGAIPGLRQNVAVSGWRGGNASAFQNEDIGGGNQQASNVGIGRRFVDQNNFDRRMQIPVQAARAGQMFFGFFDGTVDIGAMLDALVADNKAQLLANPNVLTVNHQQANIQMVDEFPIQEFGTEASGRSTTNIRFIDIGIKLDVTPHVLRDDTDTYVKLALRPDVSFPSGVSNGVPIVSRRVAETVAHVRNGQTLVIGGIYRNDMQNTIQKVPLLGDLPLLGTFFKRTEDSKVQTELMVFVTPMIHYTPESVTWDRMINIDDPRLASSPGTPATGREMRRD